jgi:D-beta-D-heptose 7-phosphate kinase/D-beta-D-heptose 1-phosphate adenosyltransferase
MAAALAAGGSLEDGAELATLAAGVVVGKVGTASASPDEIRACLTDEEPSSCQADSAQAPTARGLFRD